MDTLSENMQIYRIEKMPIANIRAAVPFCVCKRESDSRLAHLLKLKAFTMDQILKNENCLTFSMTAVDDNKTAESKAKNDDYVDGNIGNGLFIASVVSLPLFHHSLKPGILHTRKKKRKRRGSRYKKKEKQTLLVLAERQLK